MLTAALLNKPWLIECDFEKNYTVSFFVHCQYLFRSRFTSMYKCSVVFAWFLKTRCRLVRDQSASWLTATCFVVESSGRAQIPLGSSRHVSIKTRVERVVTSLSNRAVRQARRSQNSCARHVERVVSRRDVTWRAKWNLGLSSAWTGGRRRSTCYRLHYVESE